MRLWFTNGVVKDVDLAEALAGGGVFDEIHSRREVFEQVRVNPESRTIESLQRWLQRDATFVALQGGQDGFGVGLRNRRSQVSDGSLEAIRNFGSGWCRSPARDYSVRAEASSETAGSADLMQSRPAALLW